MNWFYVLKCAGGAFQNIKPIHFTASLKAFSTCPAYNTRMDGTQSLLELAYRLVTRLERLSVDSTWARRASGLRGGLIKAIEDAELGRAGAEARLEPLVRRGYEIVEAAAREIPERR
jgi:hypothetical protein